MPRAFEGDTSPGLCVAAPRGMGNVLRDGQARMLEEQVQMRDWDRRIREQWALASYRREVLTVEQQLHLVGRHHAVMLSVGSAASGQTRLRVASKRKQGRDQRKAEEQKQRDGDESSQEIFKNPRRLSW